MNNQDFFNKDQLTARVALLSEMIVEKTNNVNVSFESLKRIEGHSAGSKELSEKIGGYIKKQQSELTSLVSQQMLASDLAKFVETILEGTRTFVRAACSDVEKLYFSKQGELLCLQLEIEKLSTLKLQYEKQIDSLVKAEEEKQKMESESVVASPMEEVKKEKPKKKRPDQDPDTRAGRAAIDIMERKRNYKKKSS
jgi:hypothetical protein